MRTMGAALFWLWLLSGCGSTDLQTPDASGSVGVGVSGHLADMVDEVAGGTVALVLPSLEAGRPQRVVLAESCAADPGQVLAVLVDVEGYPRTVPQVVDVHVVDRGERYVVFEMELDLPFNNLEYTLRYDYGRPGRIDVVCLSGVLEGGRWCWEAVARPSGSLVIYTSESEIGEDAGFVLGKLLDFHPDLQEGMAFAQGLRLLRCICAAAELQKVEMDGGKSATMGS